MLYFESQTVQICITALLLSGCKTSDNLSGRWARSNFTSWPIKLIQSYIPDDIPSAFSFCQIENVTPQELIVVINFETWFCGVPFVAASLSHSITSWMMFLRSRSTTRIRRCNSSGMMWSGEIFKRGTLAQQYLCDVYPGPLFETINSQRGHRIEISV